jgi:hypothetical protein
LVNARPTLRGLLERALFEQGFEVMVVDGKKASFISARTAWATLHAAGFVVIYENPSLGTEERLELRTAAGDHYFDLAQLNLAAGDPEAVQQVLYLAESLRIPGGSRNPWKVT